MSHETSETIQNARGKWINVYGGAHRGKYGTTDTMLPNSQEYDTVEEAVQAAKERSQQHGILKQKMMGQ